MGVFVVGCYRPKPGRDADIDRVAADQLPCAAELWPECGLVQWPGE